MLKISVIVAYADNFVIGDNNKIPWHYEEDLKYFKKITSVTEDIEKKNIIIMGNNTYQSLGINKLPNRINIVITSNPLRTNANNELLFVESIGDSMDLCKKLLFDNIAENIFIIGGEQIYKYFFTSFYYKYLDY